MAEKYVTNQIYLIYKSRLIELSSGLRPCSLNDVSSLEYDKHLVYKSGKKQNFKIGDRVKIKLKKRQFKQMHQNFDELVTKDIGKIGTLVNFSPYGANPPSVYFPESGGCWVINPLALKNVSLSSDGSKKYNSSDLKVGDYVKFAYENDVVCMLQGMPQGNPWLEKCQHFLGQILSFYLNGFAVVSVNKYYSLIINPAALRKRSSDSKKELERPFEFSLTKVQKNNPLGKHIRFSGSFEEMLQQPFWNYQLTPILGKTGIVAYYGMAGEIGVKIDNKTWIFPEEIFEATAKIQENKPKPKRHKKKKRRGRAPTNNKFPFEVNDWVILKFAHHVSFSKTLEGLRIPEVFAQISQGVFSFQGYATLTTCVVGKYGQMIFVNTSELMKEDKFPKNEVFQQFRKTEKDRLKLQVGNDVQLYVGPQQIAKYLLDEIKVKDEIKKVILSPAKLHAFDDDNNKALLKLPSGKIYSVDPSFVTCCSEPITEIQSNALPGQTTPAASQDNVTVDEICSVKGFPTEYLWSHPREILTVSPEPFAKQPDLQTISPNNTIQQNVVFYPNTEEIVIRCVKSGQTSSNPANTENVWPLLCPKRIGDLYYVINNINDSKFSRCKIKT